MAGTLLSPLQETEAQDNQRYKQYPSTEALMAAFALVERLEEDVVFAFRLVDIVDDGIVDADVVEDTIMDIAMTLDEVEEVPINCQ
jgi:succinylarginine dihydrolase